MKNSIKSMVQNSYLDTENKYILESVLDLTPDTYIEKLCMDIIELDDFINESKKDLENTLVLESFIDKSNGLINDYVSVLVNYSGGKFTNDECVSITESLDHKELLLRNFVEACKENISNKKEIPEFNSRVLLESSSISERKKNDILLAYYEMDYNSRHIVDTYYEFVSFDGYNRNAVFMESETEDTPDKEKMKKQEKMLSFALKAVAVGTVIKVGEVLYLRKIMKEFGELNKCEPLSSFGKLTYDEDEIPNKLKQFLTWNDVNYNYKMEVYVDNKGKVICGRVYAYTCSKAKIKFNLLSQPKMGSVVKVNYFVPSNDDNKKNYYMMAMSLDDRIAHESIRRVQSYMKDYYKEQKK